MRQEESKESDFNIKNKCEMFRQYSYMDQKEIVRVSVAKSIATLITELKISQESIFVKNRTNFEGFLDIMTALVFILNDESPDIRAYVIHHGLAQILDGD